MTKKQYRDDNGKLLQTIESNEGQWHADIIRVHTMPGGTWSVILDNETRVSKAIDGKIEVAAPGRQTVTTIPTKRATLAHGLAALTSGKGVKARVEFRHTGI